MKRLQACKFELKNPRSGMTGDFRRFAGSCRFVYNKGLEACVAHYAETGKYPGYTRLCDMLAGWKYDPANAWLNEAPSQALQQSLKDLDRAYTNFFAGRSDFPTFRKKSRGMSFRIPQGFKIDQPNSRIKLPKLGWVNYRNSREIPGVPKNITVSANGSKWFVSIQTEREVETPTHPATSAVGVDVGVSNFAALSDGSFVAPAKSFERHEHRLAKYQRRMARKQKYGKNWKKAKAKVTRTYQRIADIRRDLQHKTSTAISNNHAMVAVEDLRIENMVASASGTVDQPGRRVRQKSGLNRSILDQGWGEFRRQLEYKQDWRGGMLLAVPPQYTSRTCPACGHVAAGNRKTQAKFACVKCGYGNHADTVAAINILERGMKMLEGQDTADASAGRESAARIACVSERRRKAVSSRNPPKLSAHSGAEAVGIPCL